MAILVIAAGSDLDEVVVKRLIAQGDEVRVLEPTGRRRDLWRRSGAFIAVGDADDPDLVERAAQDARTIVILSDPLVLEVVRNVLDVGPKAAVDRLVCCAPAISDEVRAEIRAGALDHVIIQTSSAGLLRRRVAPPELVAEAIDAADDLAGALRLEVDLGDPQQVKLLRL